MNNSDGSETFISSHTADRLEGWAHRAETLDQPNTLKSEVEKAMRRYFKQLDDEPVSDLYQMVLGEVEAPLLQSVMHFTGNNQSKAAAMLGLNRGTLRTKLKQYGMLD